jgi:hypothetical protein
LLGTPFDPFAHVADVKPPANGSIRYNLPNLAIFLWRLAAYRIRVSKPIHRDDAATGLVAPVGVVRFSINPVDRSYIAPANQKDREPVRLFNTNLVDINNTKRTGADKLNNSRLAPAISQIDETPGPIPVERLTSGAPAGAPEAYVSVETYDATSPNLSALDLSEVGLQLHLPEAKFSGEVFPLPPDQPPKWKIRGANLCNWEAGIEPALAVGEIAIDPVIGRLIIGAGAADRATALVDKLLITYTYGAVGPVGAHPVSRSPIESGALIRWVTKSPPPPASVPPGITVFTSLAAALAGINVAGPSMVIEIQDSLTHVLNLADPALISEKMTEGGSISLLLNRPLVIRAADDQRPIVELAQPLRFRPIKNFDVTKLSELNVRLEGLYLTRGAKFPPDLAGGHDDPLIARIALNKLEIIGCTLDPAGYLSIHDDRQPILTSIKLDESYEFLDPTEESAFNQIPNIVLQLTITGPLLIDSVYRLDVSDSIIDAGQGVDDKSPNKFAVSSATGDPVKGWGPPTLARGITVLGRMRVESIEGRGGIWVHALEVFDNQKGCIKFSYFSGDLLDRLPQNHGCVKGTETQLRFRSEIFGEPAYGQLAPSADYRIRELGPNEEAMGAFGFLSEAHKWSNLRIRFREFMPVGIRPLLIPVT